MTAKVTGKLVLFLLTTILFHGCDKIEEGKYRESNTPTTTPDTAKYYRKVLLEDYTGHQCGYCPPANAEGVRLKDVYGKQLIVMTVHAGYYARFTAPNYTYKFNIPEGEALNTFFGVISNPIGMVNRTEYASKKHIRSYQTWASIIDTMVKKEPVVKIKVTNTFNSANLSLTSNVQVEYLKALPGAYKLVLYLTEDSIVKYQTWYNHTPKDVPDYVHRHVLRAVINSTHGEVISVDPAQGATINKNYSFTLNSEWVPKHCSLIAAVYRESDFEILQAEEMEVAP